LANTQQLEKIGEGREAEMFAWGDGKILRLLRYPDGARSNEFQAAAMAAAAASGVRVPAVIGAETVNGRPGLIMERISGRDLLTELGTRPWQLLRAGRTIGHAHAMLHEVRAPDRLFPLREVMRHRIRAAAQLPENLKEFSLAALDALPDGDRLCHGDFHPGNLLMDGDQPVIIDWSNVTRGHPDGDVARTLLMNRLGSLPPGTPVLLRIGAKFARGVLSAIYLRSYRQRRQLDIGAIRKWEIPVAAARLADGIPEEVSTLLALLAKTARS